MKRFLSAVTVCMLAGVSAMMAEYKEGYYDALDGKTKETLKAAAKKCVLPHAQLNYTNLPNHWVNTDVYPDLVENDGAMCARWWDMYSDKVYLILPTEDGRASFSRNAMQREHSIPKSWWKYNGDVEYTPAYSDLWNLYPSDGTANNRKSNWPFGETQKASYDNGVTKVGTPKSGMGGGAGTVFEPADEYKGDFARSCFYMATVYDDLPWVTKYMYQQEEWPTLKPWAVEMLLDWARRDPVSEKEIRRNDAAEKEQLNRNPFVDFPELAEFIWGARTSQTFYLAEQESLDPTLPGTSAVEFISADIEDWIGVTDDGFSIIADEVENVAVFDLAGRCVLLVARADGGDSYTLAKGIYIVTAYGCKPAKIVVK